MTYPNLITTNFTVEELCKFHRNGGAPMRTRELLSSLSDARLNKLITVLKKNQMKIPLPHRVTVTSLIEIAASIEEERTLSRLMSEMI